ncbi:MAG: hypothetical protein DCC58_17300 [Chloroflexi bacterium]|nr:MAG: hypothetical protein DCC58_17300 [Chloroflexota bacterium]
MHSTRSYGSFSRTHLVEGMSQALLSLLPFDSRFPGDNGNQSTFVAHCRSTEAAELEMTEDTPERADSRLRESEARYQAVIENASDMIQSVRPDGTFEFVNAAWHKILGYSAADLDGMNIWQIIHPDELQHCIALFTRAIAGEPLENVRTTFVAKDGRSAPVEGSASTRFLDGQPIATHAFFRDISEQQLAMLIHFGR